MTSTKLLFILLILILPQTLLSQVSSLNNSIAIKSNSHSDLKFSLVSSSIGFSTHHYRTGPNRFTDTLGTKPLVINPIENQVVHPQWIKGAIIPAGLIIAGTITLLPEPYCLLSKYTIHDKVLNMFPGVNTSIDNYLQFAPLVAVFGLKAAGVKSRSDFLNQVVITAKAELLMTLIVRGMKPWIASERPSGGLNSMPSGHTAQAFVSATILDMEYRDTSPWISVAGYAIATTTGMYRMINNKHWISDVLIGAGIGIFSTKVVYYTHRYRWGKKSNIVIFPAIYKNGGGISFAMQL